MQKDINRVFPAKKDLDLLDLYAEVSSFNRVNMGTIKGSSFLETKKSLLSLTRLPGHITSKTHYPSLCIYQMREQAGKMGWFPGCFHGSHHTCDAEGRNIAGEFRENEPQLSPVRTSHWKPLFMGTPDSPQMSKARMKIINVSIEYRQVLYIAWIVN